MTDLIPVALRTIPVKNRAQPALISGFSRACSLTLAVTAALCAGFAPLAEASYRDSETYRDSVQRAQVISVDPLYETVEVRKPRQQCFDERVRDTSRAPAYPGDRRYASRSRTPGVVGAIIGGAIGHSVGRGKTNKKIGTAVGAILGGSIGGDISRRNQEREYWGRQRQNVRYRTERVCEVVDEVHSEERISGYDVAYAYGGETYSTVLDYDPGRYVEVRVSVTPVP